MYKSIQKHIFSYDFCPFIAPTVTPRFDPEGSRKSFGTGAVRHSLSNPSPGRVQGPSGSQEKPQEGPTRGPRGPREGPKRGPKRGPACRAQARRRGPTPPAVTTAQEAPQTNPRRPKRAPKEGQESPKTAMRAQTGLKMAPKTAKSPRSSSRRPSSGKDGPSGPQDVKRKTVLRGGPRGLRRTLRIPDVHPAKREEY